MSEERRAFLVLAVEHWKNVDVKGQIVEMPVDRSGLPGYGYCPVFETREEAERAYPDRPVVVLSVKPSEEANE